jgi:hypothetical protein
MLLFKCGLLCVLLCGMLTELPEGICANQGTQSMWDVQQCFYSEARYGMSVKLDKLFCDQTFVDLHCIISVK